MVTSNRFLRIALFCCAVVLSGCSQTITDSVVIISEKLISDEEKGSLVGEVYKKAEGLGGDCQLLSKNRQYHLCVISVRSGSIKIGIGYSARQKFVIDVSSTIAHAIPPADEKVTAGYYLPSLHEELEEWVLSLLPPEAIVSAERSYIGYNASREF